VEVEVEVEIGTGIWQIDIGGIITAGNVVGKPRIRFGKLFVLVFQSIFWLYNSA